jgi:hypothetical protein
MAGAKAEGVFLCLLLAIFSFSCSSYQVLDLKDEVWDVCKHYIAKNLGSPGDAHVDGNCCKKVREVNVQTFCHEFTENDIDKKISPREWADVAKRCNKPLPVGFNCAGYIVRPQYGHQ